MSANGCALTISHASSIDCTASTASTGPKISSSVTREPTGRPSITAGATKWPWGGAVPGWWTRAPCSWAVWMKPSMRSLRGGPITGGTSTPKRSRLVDQQLVDGAVQALDQRVRDPVVDERAGGGRALLAREAERAVDQRGDDVVEVGVGVHDHAVLAAHLGHDALEVALAGGELARPS